MQEVSNYLQAAKALNLIHLGNSAGVVYWKPAGLRLYEKLRSFIRAVHHDNGYQEVRTPSLVQLNVFEQSGHLAKYKDYMFCANQDSSSAELNLNQYGLRPMSCPNHIELWSSERRSYRELPVRFFEFGEVFRNEPDGSLQVLFRQRQFCQDDSHVFVRNDQLLDEVAHYLDVSRKVYEQLGFESVSVAISLRPSMRFGDDSLWDLAEESLRQACRAKGIEFEEEPGGGAFYGPKIELKVKDKRGRSWQLGVIQLDYVLPKRFGLEYVASDDSRGEPVLLHHAILGSLERMVGILLEVHGVNLPEQLHPYPCAVVAVSEKSQDYARQLGLHLRQKGQEVLVDEQQDSLGAKLRGWRQKGCPQILVVGEAEAQEHAESGVFAASLSSGGKNVPVKL